MKENITKIDTRPSMYHYYKQLMIHLEDDRDIIFSGNFVYPRQMEIHLPSNHISSCNLHCPHCAGKYFNKDLGTWELEGLELLNKLQGNIPYHIYGGAYTEPLMNPYFMTFLHTTKKFGNHFGIHTNGTYLLNLEEQQGWLTELNRISTGPADYLSVSVDAGIASSWAKTKGTPSKYLFNEIIAGIKKAVQIRNSKHRGHSIRVCYLISPYSDSRENFTSIINILREIGVDSLRFSIPFACYNQTFNNVRKYKGSYETPMNNIYKYRLRDFLSVDENEKPYIFYTGPEFTDIDKFDFKNCAYGYYQITIGADGYLYKCSTTATPTMAMCRLGKVTSEIENFKDIILKNQDIKWDTDTCFSKGARCNRMGLEINREYAKG